MVEQLKKLSSRAQARLEDRRIKIFLANEAQYQTINEAKVARADNLRAAREAKREANFQRMLATVNAGLDGDVAVLNETEAQLHFVDQWKDHKKRQIHHEWETGVYEPIARRVKQESDERFLERMDGGTRAGHARPLYRSGTLGTMQRDLGLSPTIPRPLRNKWDGPQWTGPPPPGIKVKVVTKDPTKKELVKYARERMFQLSQPSARGRVGGGSGTGTGTMPTTMTTRLDGSSAVPLKALYENMGRSDVFDVCEWHNVTSHPHGYTPAPRDPDRNPSRVTNSQVVNTHWGYPVGDEGAKVRIYDETRRDETRRDEMIHDDKI